MQMYVVLDFEARTLSCEPILDACSQGTFCKSVNYLPFDLGIFCKN